MPGSGVGGALRGSPGLIGGRMDNQEQLVGLCRDLFARGLGELLMIRNRGTQVMLGNLVMDKGALTFKDRGLLRDVEPARVAPCWDIGITGAICNLPDKDWDSLSYLGPDLCHIPVNLSTTRHRLLRSVVNLAGEDMITFQGSAYRGFKMLLDAHLLPVVLPLVIETHSGVLGLAVTDFRYASVPLETVLAVNDAVRASVERQVCLTVEDFEVSAEEFGSLFSGYLKEK
jgi:hypothetical protein